MPHLPNYREDYRRRNGQFPRPIAHGQPFHGEKIMDEDYLYPVASPDETLSASKSRRFGSLSRCFLLALGCGFGPIFQRAGKGDHIQFLVPAIIGMGINFLSLVAIMIGRTLGGATVATMQGSLSLLLPFLRDFGRTSGDCCRRGFWS